MTWYKRFGYKQPSGVEGGEYSKYTLFRFVVVLMGFFTVLLSGLTSRDFYATLYLATGMLYVVASFIPELFPEVRNLMVLLVANVIIYSLQEYGVEIFRYYDHTIYAGAVDHDGLSIFTYFNVLLGALSFVFMWPFGKGS